MDKTAACQIHSKDEIGVLANNVNSLYQNLLATIENLEIEKQRVREMEQSKVDFLRAASHELKTPLTALNATLENMVLGIDHASEAQGNPVENELRREKHQMAVSETKEVFYSYAKGNKILSGGFAVGVGIIALAVMAVLAKKSSGRGKPGRGQ